MAIVVISHQMGAGGPEVGTALAERLGYRPPNNEPLACAELDDAGLMRGGGQWLLRGVPHALRVRIVAPFEQRVRHWIKRTAEVSGETPNQRAAADFVRRDDAEKAGRMRYLYEGDVAGPSLYELILNTEKLTPA